MTRETPHPLGPWGTLRELEIRCRIQVAVGAYAYEIADDPVMPDAMYDWMAQRVRPHVGTCHPLLDEFFVVRFSPMTGMWIHEHPELSKIARIYRDHGDALRRYYSDAKHLPKAVRGLPQPPLSKGETS